MYAATRGFWAEQFLLELGAPINTHTIDGILAWMEGENTKARNNPLATTRAAFDATDFNSAGVKNYRTFSDGMTATVETITLAPYKTLLKAIHSGISAHAIATEIVRSPWGTQHVPLHDILDNPFRYAAVPLHN